MTTTWTKTKTKVAQVISVIMECLGGDFASLNGGKSGPLRRWAGGRGEALGRAGLARYWGIPVSALAPAERGRFRDRVEARNRARVSHPGWRRAA
jgi:hypothetical protein